MNIQCFTHVPFENAANIGCWAEDRAHVLGYTHLYRNPALPSLNAFDMLAIMGGPMNIYDHDAYPWLVVEKAFIRQVIDAGKTVIGVCLGSQLIADVLGAKVMPNTHKEIGWYPVTLTEAGADTSGFSALPMQMDVFHWHGDTFSLPAGSIHLASSPACANQAFLYGQNVLGLQFHMEYSPESIEKMLAHCGDEIVESPYISTDNAIRAGYDKIPQTKEWLYALLDAFTNSA